MAKKELTVEDKLRALYDLQQVDSKIDNLRTLAALRLLRDQPKYSIAAVAVESGFTNVRMLQRRIQEAIGMSPVDYRLMITRDLT